MTTLKTVYRIFIIDLAPGRKTAKSEYTAKNGMVKEQPPSLCHDLNGPGRNDAVFPAQTAAGAFFPIDLGFGAVPDKCARYRAGGGAGAALGSAVGQTCG